MLRSPKTDVKRGEVVRGKSGKYQQRIDIIAGYVNNKLIASIAKAVVIQSYLTLGWTNPRYKSKA